LGFVVSVAPFGRVDEIVRLGPDVNPAEVGWENWGCG
jgi:hypothetical protein